MAYKRNSHLRATPVIEGYADLWVPPVVPDFTQAEQVEIIQKYVQRPDLLAYDLYDDAGFWWIFSLFNKNELVNPINDMTLGRTIWVPTRAFVSGI